jgi:carboxyl-terminal processing protease
LRYIYLILQIIIISFISAKKNDVNFSNSENTDSYLEMLDDAFYKLKETYVDSINESEIIKEGIKGMVKKLDPYTSFLSGTSKDRLDVLKSGKYRGVGIQIGVVRDTLSVLSVFEDSPAYSIGLETGDKIIKIDTVKTKGMKTREASKLIKGEKGTIVDLTIYRTFTKEKLIFSITRGDVKVNHVPYWGIDEEGVGYIKITKFSKNTSNDFKKALKSMKSSNLPFKGLIIDLRSNTGGLLRNAISILDALIERGTKLLYTKGRTFRSSSERFSRLRPMVDRDFPIVVLVNKNSASASEIVAGVLQDLDRAVIVGQKSFGKGLVQSMYNLNDSTTLKVTTSKYFMPYSNRLIQKKDYFSSQYMFDQDEVQKDTVLFTRGGRPVVNGNGITPDLIIENEKVPPFVNSLWQNKMFLSFANYYLNNNSFTKVDQNIIKSFENFVKSYKIDYKLEGEKELDKFKDIFINSDFDQYEESIFNKLFFWKQPKSKIEILTLNIDKFYEEEKKKRFVNPSNVKWIVNGLERELAAKSINSKKKSESIKISLKVDKQYIHGKKIILDTNRYFDILTSEGLNNAVRN